MIFRHLKLGDVSEMLKWGVHNDARLYHYGFKYKDPKMHKRWYKSKYKMFRKYIFGGFVGNQLVGYITLKEINWFSGSAMMGIAIDPNRLNKGFGQTLIHHYLEHVFNHTPIKKIELWVATFNQRAIACYKRSGFKELREEVRLYEEQCLGYEIITSYPETVVKTDKEGIYVSYVRMVITKDLFKKQNI